MTATKLDTFTTAYIEAMFWSSTLEPFGECASCGKEAPLVQFAKDDAETEHAEWTLCGECGNDGGNSYEPPADENYGLGDLAPEALERIIADCERFQTENRLSLSVYQDTREYGQYSGEELAGHDFWLTRNGHGTGFWDRFHAKSTALIDIDRDKPEERKQAILSRLGDKLTKRCGWRTTYPEVSLYVGDDGKVYLA